jgi:hypothetical protein
MNLGAVARTALGEVAGGLLLSNLPRETTVARDCNRLALLAGSNLDAVGVSRSIGESAIEVALLEVQNTLLAVRNVLGEEIVEVVGLQSHENAAAIGNTGSQDQVEQESAETTSLARRNRGDLSF